jgi:5-methylcytosine-specific restriction endonuclease McrA
MNEPVEIEARRPFRQRDIQRRFYEQGGCCALCPADIAGGFIADHRVPRALGGKTNYANLSLLCLACDSAKTFGHGQTGDIQRIAKAKRTARKHDPLTRPKTKQPLRSRGFDKRLHHHMDGTTSERRR